MADASGSLEIARTSLFAGAMAMPLVYAVVRWLGGEPRAAAWAVATAGLVGATWLADAERHAAYERRLAEADAALAARREAAAPRRIDPAARQAMVEALGRYAGQRAFVVANATDAETVAYARQIVAVFKDAGWDCPPSFGMMFTPIALPDADGEAGAGVVLGVAEGVPTALASAVFTALRAGGVDVRRGPHWPGTDLPFSILVGPRPDAARAPQGESR